MISTSMTEASTEADFVVVIGLKVPIPDHFTPSLKHILCIYYPVWFKKNQAKIRALLDFADEVNAIVPAYMAKLSLKVWLINVGAQKIDGYILETFGMILASFQVEDKLGKACFFQEIFLLVTMNVDIILAIFFLTFSNADI